jgi:hypothetical protein
MAMKCGPELVRVLNADLPQLVIGPIFRSIVFGRGGVVVSFSVCDTWLHLCS